MLAREREAWAARLFQKAGVDSPGLCARLLMAHVLNMDKLAYVLAENRQLDEDEEALFFSLAERRAQGEPLAWLLGKKEFFEHEFVVNPHTLVPRPETELMVELALEKVKSPSAIFADLGCGSGCIGLSLLAKRPGWRGILLEKSAGAIHIARINAKRIAPRAIILRGDIFNLPFQRQCLDILLANPPYIGLAEKNLAMREVLEHEPHMALFSGDDGLEHLRAIAVQAPWILRSGGMLLLEHGAGQRDAAAEILQSSGFANISFYNDLAGLPRCVLAIKG